LRLYVSGHVSAKKEALWFDETAASISRFTVTTPCTGLSLVQSYSGVKLTNERAEGSGDPYDVQKQEDILAGNEEGRGKKNESEAV